MQWSSGGDDSDGLALAEKDAREKVAYLLAQKAIEERDILQKRIRELELREEKRRNAAQTGRQALTTHAPGCQATPLSHTDLDDMSEQVYYHISCVLYVLLQCKF